MSKVTKRELLRRIEALEEWSNGADDMLTELNHALPDPEYDAKCEENAVVVQESLDRHAVRLGLVKPKLKVLDQSVFDGADPKYITAATNEDGRTFLFPVPKSELEHALGCWFSDYRGDSPRVDGLFDTTDWQNSLIERDKVELTSNDYYHSGIASKLLERGQKLVVCFVSNVSEADALNKKDIEVITSVDTEFNDADDYGWKFVIPINNHGEPLTAADVGL